MLHNWKTTLAGLGAAFLNLYANGTNLKAAAVSIALAAVGALAKDHSTP